MAGPQHGPVAAQYDHTVQSIQELRGDPFLRRLIPFQQSGGFMPLRTDQLLQPVRDTLIRVLIYI